MLLDVVYLAVLLAALPWVAWRRWSGGRPVAAPWARFVGSGPTPAPSSATTPRPRLWLHGVSVGEVQLLAGLSREIVSRSEAAGRPVEIVVSSSTTTGLEVARRRFGAAAVFPCPLDFTWAVRRTFHRLRPDILVLGELELWPNLLAEAARREVPVAIANGRMSERSARGYARVGALVRRMLSRVALVSARSEADAARFRALGAPRVVNAGSMKFDGVRGDRDGDDVRRLARLAGFAPDDVVFLAGSTQDPEEHLAIEAYLAARADFPRLRLVLVPRHVERAAEVAALLDRAGLPWRRRSDLDGAAPPAPDCRVLLVDTTGELGAWWGTTTIAFVGGSLDGKRGGQNMLEPAAYGAAVCFGPSTRNFADEVAVLLARDAARVVADGAELTAFVRACLADPSAAGRLGDRARHAVRDAGGATPLTARAILDLLPPADGPAA